MSEVSVGPALYRVLAQLAMGKTETAIAMTLNLRLDTVRKHIQTARMRGIVANEKYGAGTSRPKLLVDINEIGIYPLMEGQNGP